MVGLIVIASGAACSWFGSGAGVPLQSGSQDPAAQGTVKTKLTNDGNTAVTVNVKHLAPPDRIARGATTYVVWAHPLGVPSGAASSDQRSNETAADATPAVVNLGGLKIDHDLDGKLSTTTPYHSFDLFITAEPSAMVDKPSSERALWATVTHE